MQWIPRHPQQETSATHRGFGSMRKECDSAVRNMIELQQLRVSGANMNLEPFQTRYHRAVQQKNTCLARALCPAQYAAAAQCILDPTRVEGGSCDPLLAQVRHGDLGSSFFSLGFPIRRRSVGMSFGNVSSILK